MTARSHSFSLEDIGNDSCGARVRRRRARCRLPAVLAAVLALTLVSPARAHGGQGGGHSHIPFSLGDTVELECLLTSPNGTTVYVDQNGQPIFGAPPTCVDTGLPWSFRFGTDEDFVCRWLIDLETYELLRNLILTQGSYHCRVPLTKDKAYYMPMPISLWGGIEPGHIHVMNHLNFVFHSAEGFFLGAAAYPLRDHFQMIMPGQLLTFHGPVSWFSGHKFDPLPLAEVPTPTPEVAPPPPPSNAPDDGLGTEERLQQQILSKALAAMAPPDAESSAKPVEPEIPLSPRPTMKELSERACYRDLGFVPPGWVAAYCVASGIAGALLVFAVFRGFIMTEGLVERRKKK